MVADAKHLVTHFTKASVTHGIQLFSAIVRIAIEFHNEPASTTTKVDNILAKDDLPRELMAALASA
jgi:hypothetical protein